MSMATMQRATIDDTELEFAVRGAGEPVLLLHCGFIADSCAPLLGEPTLAAHYRLISYHRRGYGRSRRPDGPVSLARQAADARGLLRHLGIERAHVAGHSYGGSVALQLAVDYPEAVHSLALLEPLLPGVPTDPAAQQYFLDAVMGAVGRYQAGDGAGAVDRFLQGACQPGYRPALERALPGAFEQAVADADAAFQAELPAIQGWRITAADAARFRGPVLSAVHRDELWAGFAETHDVLRSWFPWAETAAIPDATHLLQVMNPGAVAEALAGFFRRHPLREPAHAPA